MPNQIWSPTRVVGVLQFGLKEVVQVWHTAPLVFCAFDIFLFSEKLENYHLRTLICAKRSCTTQKILFDHNIVCLSSFHVYGISNLIQLHSIC